MANWLIFALLVGALFPHLLVSIVIAVAIIIGFLLISLIPIIFWDLFYRAIDRLKQLFK